MVGIRKEHVLRLASPDSPYEVAGVYQRQEQSALLSGFRVSVDAVFDAATA